MEAILELINKIKVLDQEIDVSNERLVELYKKEIALLEKRTEWQPIETAPKDHRMVLLCNINKYYEDHIGVGFCDKMDGRVYWSGFSSDPTHWMPLPEPPKESE